MEQEAVRMIVLFIVLLHSTSAAWNVNAKATATATAPAVYVFGDSLADVGNNNYVKGTDSKANFPHNGVDYPHATPTGRFSNGYNVIDFLAMHLGFSRSPPPYLSLRRKATRRAIVRRLRGANFASGSSGILDATGDAISMSKQIEYFAKLKSDMMGRGTMRKAKKLNSTLSKSVFFISAGGNDLLRLAFSSTNATQIFELLTSNYKDHIKALYDLGARKFALLDVGPMGCCPIARSLHPTGDCINSMNTLASGFNAATEAMLSSLNSTLKGMKYTIARVYALISDLIAEPDMAGYKEVKNACCGSGAMNAGSGCTPEAVYCEDRNQYLFWDRIHPTHATAKRAGDAFYGGSLQYARPINLKQLVED